MHVTFYMAIPKSSKKKQETYGGTYHYIKPDLSNMLKFTEDIAQSIIYADDCIIAQVSAKKIYDHNPRTEFFFVQLDNESLLNKKDLLDFKEVNKNIIKNSKGCNEESKKNT